MTIDTTTPALTMSASAYQVLCDYLGLAGLPHVLRVIPRGFREAERRAVVESAWRELRENGHADHRGPTMRVTELITMLHRFDRAIDAQFHGDAELRAQATASGNIGVLATLAAERLVLREVHPASLSTAMVSLLPPTVAGPGHSLALPRDVLEAAVANQGARNIDVFEAQLRLAGVPPAEAKNVSRVFDRPLRRGVFGVSITNAQGRRLRGDHVLTWVDNRAGRYLIEDSTALDGQQWTTIAPTTPHRLAAQLDRLLDMAAAA